MRYQKAIWMAILAACGAGSASAQDRLAPSFSATLSIRSAGGTGGYTGRSLWTQYRATNASATRSLGPIKLEAQRNAFVSRVRLPLVSLWNGRVQVAAMHQRLRNVNEHSAVLVPDAASSLRVAQPGVLTTRSRNSYGGGIWFHLGRRRA